MTFSNRNPGYGKSKIRNSYSKKPSPLLTLVINALTFSLILILFINCMNIIGSYKSIDSYKRQLAEQERKESLMAAKAASAGLNNDKPKPKDDSDVIPSILPCKGTLTSKFGGRTLSISRGKSEFHSGLDISNSSGTEVKASADGIVEISGLQGSYGNLVVIRHNETYTTYYGHNSKLLVRKGDAVKKGQTIALMGSTGRSTGPHVHFEIRVNNKPVNPLDIIKN